MKRYKCNPNSIEIDMRGNTESTKLPQAYQNRPGRKSLFIFILVRV